MSKPFNKLTPAQAELLEIAELTDQRDNAWQELREVREAINANPEESTTDEVRRVFSKLEREKAELVAQVAVQSKLLRCWQTWLGASRDQCDDSGMKLWDKIDASCSTPAQHLNQIKAETVLSAISACENPMLVVTDCHTDTQKIIDCCEVADLKSYAASIAKGE